jgi:spoIIIJ-associated protein
MKKRFEGRNLDEALDSAAQTFGVERYRLSYHVVLEKRGFLGGMKRIVIEADVNEGATPPPGLEEDAQPTGPIENYSLVRDVREERPRRGRGQRRRGPDRDGRGGRAQRPAPHFPQEPREPVPEQGPQSDAAAKVHEWCQEMMDRARLAIDVRTEEDDEQIRVKLYGPDSRLMTAHGGELLDSVQVLVTKALVGEDLDKPVELDCRGFKQQRANELVERARAVADRVRRDGREQMLEAMSPIERRIVHLALQDDAEVGTESRGEGFYKRIAIIPRKQEETTPAES